MIDKDVRVCARDYMYVYTRTHDRVCVCTCMCVLSQNKRDPVLFILIYK